MAAQNAGPGDPAFVPVLRLAVCSDAHIRAADDLYCGRLREQMRAVYAIAATDRAYDRVDAFLIAGDSTDRGEREQYAAFWEAVCAEKRSDTEIRAVVAKNHDNWSGGKNGNAYYREQTGLPTDFHAVIRGFHVIGISTCEIEGEYYAPEQRDWLTKQLREAAADDGEKPIFVMHHEHVKDTVYGSTDTDGWGIAYFKDIFVQYPQIIHLSGHSHYPINDPRSVYQKEFTAVGVGALHYAELTVDGQNKRRPVGVRDINEGWIIEVDAQYRVRLRGFDYLTGTQIASYTLEHLADRSCRTLTPEQQEARSGAPQFPAGALPAVQIDGERVYVTIPRAESTDGFPVVLYRAQLLDADGAMIEAAYAVPPYWRAHALPCFTLTLPFSPRASSVRALAENAYGMASAPLQINI